MLIFVITVLKISPLMVQTRPWEAKGIIMIR